MQRVVILWIILGLAGCVSVSQSRTTAETSVGTQGIVRVEDFGAKGDGTTDNTGAFQAALDALAGTGGIVRVPNGSFLIRGHLSVPEHVTLEGVWQAPSRGVPETGTVLLAVEGKGSTDGPPFIMLHTNSMLKGLTIFYPEQVEANPPHPYPWTVRGTGDNCTILDVTLVNPYMAVDFGTMFCGRHYINGLYAQALYRGLFIDQCYDVGRIENIHFWPFWTGKDRGDLFDFTYEHGIAFQIARTDGEMGVNLFQIFYNIGFHFIDAGHGGGSGMYTNIYSDVSPIAVRVEASHGHAPISFTNGSFMTAAVVEPKKQTLVNFDNCGFWSVRDTRYHAKLEGPAIVTMTGCTFYDWDRAKAGVAAIESNCDSLVVTGSQFIMRRHDAAKIRLGPDTNAAVIVGNRMRDGVVIDNQAGPGADVQIGLNAGQ